MPYNAELAERIRGILQSESGLSEKRMFGGLAFLINGHLAASASSRGGMLLRVDPTQTEALVASPHVARFEMRGRKMDGWLAVGLEAVSTKETLREWLRLGVAYARSLPRK